MDNKESAQLTVPVSLLSRGEYMDRFTELSKSLPYYRNAYEAVEEEYIQLYGLSRYRTYESFRVAKTRHYKQLRIRARKRSNLCYQ